MHVEWYGEGPSLVLGHGFAGSARNFRPQIRAFRERYRIGVYDARGHARSPAPADPAAYRLDAFVDDLAALVERRAVVGGLSMGAGVALLFALRQPERLRGLVLAAPPPGRGAVGGSPAGAHAFADAIESEGLEAAGARFVWGPASGLDAGAAGLVRQGFLEHPPHGLANTLRGCLAELPTPEELRPRLATLEVPTLVVTGSEDSLSRGASETLAAALPDARLCWIEGAGHVVNLARPDAFNACLAEFLDGLPL